jgi:hypothetical protein
MCKDCKKTNIAKNIKEKACESHTEEVYDEMMEELITKNWRRLGYSDRDWIKNKIIFFDENSKLRVQAKDKFKAEQKEKEKLEKLALQTLTNK